MGDTQEKKRDRRPIFSKRIFMQAMIKQEEERKAKEQLLIAATRQAKHEL